MNEDFLTLTSHLETIISTDFPPPLPIILDQWCNLNDDVDGGGGDDDDDLPRKPFIPLSLSSNML